MLRSVHNQKKGISYSVPYGIHVFNYGYVPLQNRNIFDFLNFLKIYTLFCGFTAIWIPFKQIISLYCMID